MAAAVVTRNVLRISADDKLIGELVLAPDEKLIKGSRNLKLVLGKRLAGVVILMVLHKHIKCYQEVGGFTFKGKTYNFRRIDQSPESLKKGKRKG